VEEAIESEWRLEAIMVSSRFLRKDAYAQLIGKAVKKDIPVREVTEREFGKLSDTVSSQGIAAVVIKREYSPDSLWKEHPADSLVVGLEGLSDPGNAGTILRSCDWFGARAVLVSAGAVDIFNPKVVRSTMGALFHLPVIACPDLRGTLRNASAGGFTLISTVPEEGKPLSLFKFPKRSVLIFGSEARGISPEILSLSDDCITIPRFGRGESLNVAVSCGIILAAWRTQAGVGQETG